MTPMPAKIESVLLIGAGSSHERLILVGNRTSWEDQRVVTLDINRSHGTDVVWDLNQTPWPFEDNSFEEIHAYEILEHLGHLGDEHSFFSHFYECWRILVPGGHLAAKCPVWNSPWALGDPGHRRVITKGSLSFLDQEEYRLQVGKTPMSDYRSIWHGDFHTEIAQETADTLGFVLRAIKPARV